MNVRREEDTISTPPPPPPPVPPTWSPLGVASRKVGGISGSGGRPPLHPRTPTTKSKKTKITMINSKSPPPTTTSKHSSSKSVSPPSKSSSLTTGTGTVKSPPPATRDALMISRKLFHPSYDNNGGTSSSSLNPAADETTSTTIKSSATKTKGFFKESSTASTIATTDSHNSSPTKRSFFEGMTGSDSSNNGNVRADEARDDDDETGSNSSSTTNQSLDLSIMWNAITDLLQPSSSSPSNSSHIASSQAPQPSSETTFLSMEEIEALMNQQIPVEMANRIDFDAFTYRHLNPPSRPKDDYTKMFHIVDGHYMHHHQAPQLQLDSTSTSISYLSMVVKECFTDLTSGSSSSLSTSIIKSNNGKDWIRISRPPCIPHVEQSIRGLQDVANRLHFVVDYFWNIVLMTTTAPSPNETQQQEQQSKYITATFQRNVIGSYMGTLEWMERQIQSSSTLAIVAATAAVGKEPAKPTTISSDRVIEVKKLLVDTYVGTTQRIETLIGLLQVFKRTREIIDFIPNIGVLYCYDQHTTEQNLRLNKYMIRWFYQHYNSSNIRQYCREMDIVNMAVDYDLSSVAVFEWIGNAIDIVYQPTKGKHLVPTNCLYEHISSKKKANKKKEQEMPPALLTATAPPTKEK